MVLLTQFTVVFLYIYCILFIASMQIVLHKPVFDIELRHFFSFFGVVMAMKRKRARRDRGGFAKTNRSHPINYSGPPMRGGRRI